MGSPRDPEEMDFTHYCEDCEHKLEIWYDERPSDDIAIVCATCGGNNTRRLEEVEA